MANAQGHLWRVPCSAPVPAVTAIAPSGGPASGGTVVTVTGTDLNAGGTPGIKFGTVSGSAVSCASATSCTATSPAVAGAGAVDVTVTNGSGQTSVTSGADVFTYTTPPTAVSVSTIKPSSGVATGGTTVTITGANLTDPAGGATTVSFGANPATTVSCASSTSCAAVSPPGSGTVDVQVTAAGSTSPAVKADQFTYVHPVADLNAYGITAPKGGVVFLPGALGGHWWSSDHAQGFCRMDPVPGTKLVAINSAVCDPGFTISSPGQATYDPSANADGTHYVYVPDNECLTNIEKHAAGRHAQVRLTGGAHTVRLEIHDDGRGLPAKGFDPRSERHFGLRLIADAAQDIGGKMQVFSSGSGTTVLLEVPSRTPLLDHSR